MKTSLKHSIANILFRMAIFPFSFFPYPLIRFMGRQLGTIAYYCGGKHRKQTLHNLTMAKGLALTTQEMIAVAKGAFQNLCIVFLELIRFSRNKCLDDILSCDNPEIIDTLASSGKGAVIFCGHLSNWELLFFHLSSHYKSVAIAKPMNNPKLYRWLVNMREMFGGRIIDAKNALLPCRKALKQGDFVVIAGDQAFPASTYSHDFLGMRAWSSPSPAHLAYKAGCPLCVATTVRDENGRYHLHYSDPILPDSSLPARDAIYSMMDSAMAILEKSIKEHPNQWLWQHARWKRHSGHHGKKLYRYDAVAIVMPTNAVLFEMLNKTLPLFSKLFPSGAFHIMVPEQYRNLVAMENATLCYYTVIKEILFSGHRFEIVFDFSGEKSVVRHYKPLSVSGPFPLKNVLEKSASSEDFCRALTEVIVKSPVIRDLVIKTFYPEVLSL